MKNNDANPVATALLSGDENALRGAIMTYLITALEQFHDSSLTKEPGDLPSGNWDSAVENLELDTYDALQKTNPDLPDEEAMALIDKLRPVTSVVQNEVADEVDDSARDAAAYAQDPYAYYGVRRSDF